MVRRSLQQSTPPPPSPASDFGAGIMITVLILAIAVILSASFYLLLRFLRRHRHRHPSLSSSSSSDHHHHHHNHRHNNRQVSPGAKNPLIDALPLFTFDSLSSGRDSDCAVCLSKFEPKDLLRLLPICCHAFHAECIDTWLAGNQSCPLCRSAIFVSENDLAGKFSLLRQNSHTSVNSSSSRSFRVEIGNVSRRAGNSGEIRHSYSIGDSFDYVVDDVVSEVTAGSFRMPAAAEFKVDPTVVEEQENDLAAEVGTRGGGGG